MHTGEHTRDEIVRERIDGRVEYGDELIVIERLDELMQLFARGYAATTADTVPIVTAVRWPTKVAGPDNLTGTNEVVRVEGHTAR